MIDECMGLVNSVLDKLTSIKQRLSKQKIKRTN